jgi:magnesium-protoporphyrin IX monomethyl ester (oxidative) cyclase
MATYLSEKIGYARYITIFRHLEQHPEHRFHPMFNWFKEWCNDEYRHGEALALLLRAQPKLLTGVNRLWIRFFQLSVFATMFVRDHHRVEFHQALGIEPEPYGMQVFKTTLEISQQIFPLLLDLENPAFLQGLRALQALAVRIEAATKQGGLLGAVKKLTLQARAAATFLGLYLLPTKSNVPPQKVRLAATW